MNFSDLVKQRYSVRKYDSRPVEPEKLAAILEAGRLAPTAVNYQPQKIYVVKSPAVMQKLAATSSMRFAFRAPVVLVIGYDRNVAWKNEAIPGHCSGETDAAIVATHMMLAAWEQGVGSCWIGVFDGAAEALGLPENIVVTALMPLGYPAENAVPSPLHSQSRELSEMVTVL